MKKNSVLVFILLVAALLLAFFYLQPLMEEDSGLELKVGNVEKIRTQAEDSLTKAKKTKQAYDAMTEMEKEKIKKQIPLNLDQQAIIDDLGKIATTQGMILSSVSFSRITGKELPHRISILANFTSSTTNNLIVSLLQATESNDRYLALRSIAVNLSKTRSDYTLTLEAYYQQ